MGTDLKTGSFIYMRARKNSLKQWRAEKRNLYMITVTAATVFRSHTAARTVPAEKIMVSTQQIH